MSGLFKAGEYASLHKDLLADQTIGLAAKIVYLGLQTYLAGDKVQAWPGPAGLAKCTGLCRRAIQKGIDRLVATGWITKESSAGPGPQKPNLYTLHAQRIPCASASCAPGVAHSVREGSARRALKENNEGTPLKNPKSARRLSASPDPRVKTFIDWFVAEYGAVLGRGYIVAGGKDGATVKRLLKAMALPELQKAAKAMMADPWGRERASIGLLASQINAWRGTPSTKANPGRGGRYTPAALPAGTDYNSVAEKFG